MEKIKYITVACPRCDKKHKILPKFLGRKTGCKRCKEKFELRPREAVVTSNPEKGENDELISTSPTGEKEYYIPVSLTSNPMVDPDYERDSRAQTSFVKKSESTASSTNTVLLFIAVFLAIAAFAFLGYWFLLR